MNIKNYLFGKTSLTLRFLRLHAQNRLPKHLNNKGYSASYPKVKCKKQVNRYRLLKTTTL